MARSLLKSELAESKEKAAAKLSLANVVPTRVPIVGEATFQKPARSELLYRLRISGVRARTRSALTVIPSRHAEQNLFLKWN